jgi:hypothetical protein
MAPLGRKAADSLAGEEIVFHNNKSKVKDVQGMPPHDAKLIAPLFNLASSTATCLSYNKITNNFIG